MAYIGLDVHKKFIECAIIKSPSRRADKSFTLTTDRDSIKIFARSLSKKDKVVLENTGNAFSIASLLKLNSKASIVISNPMQTKAITSSKVKTDKVDALALANLIAADFIPVVWEPDANTITLRRLVAYYESIRTQRTGAKNRIHAILQRNIICYPNLDLFSKSGLKFLSTVSLPVDELAQVKEELALLENLKDRLEAIKKRIARITVKDGIIRRLMTITGIDLFTAASLKAAIGNDISRFPSPKKLVSYFGLSCSITQSADKCYIGRITKRGNIFARAALVQAAQVVVKYPSPLRAFFRRLNAKKGRNKAITAVASKMARIIWFMLTRGEDYRYALPMRTRLKMTRLNFMASGIRTRSKIINRNDKGTGKKAEIEYRAFISNRGGTRK